MQGGIEPVRLRDPRFKRRRPMIDLSASSRPLLNLGLQADREARAYLITVGAAAVTAGEGSHPRGDDPACPINGRRAQKTPTVRSIAQRGRHRLEPSARREPGGFQSFVYGMGKGQLACPAAYGPSSVLEARESRCRNG